jgi:hypothetical protein
MGGIQSWVGYPGDMIWTGARSGPIFANEWLDQPKTRTYNPRNEKSDRNYVAQYYFGSNGSDAAGAALIAGGSRGRRPDMARCGPFLLAR